MEKRLFKLEKRFYAVLAHPRKKLKYCILRHSRSKDVRRFRPHVCVLSRLPEPARRDKTGEREAAKEGTKADQNDENGGDAEQQQFEMGPDAAYDEAQEHERGYGSQPEQGHGQRPGEKSPACSSGDEDGIEKSAGKKSEQESEKEDSPYTFEVERAVEHAAKRGSSRYPCLFKKTAPSENAEKIESHQDHDGPGKKQYGGGNHTMVSAQSNERAGCAEKTAEKGIGCYSACIIEKMVRYRRSAGLFERVHRHKAAAHADAVHASENAYKKNLYICLHSQPFWIG